MANTESTCQAKGFLVIQEGGASNELYLHAFDTLKDAERYRRKSGKATWRTGPVIEAPLSLIDHPGFFEVVERLFDSIGDIEYPRP